MNEVLENLDLFIILYSFLSFFLLLGSRHLVLDFIFFYDKSKSFKRKYRKTHGFFYRWFSCFVFNKEYMNASKYKKYIFKHHVINALLIVFDILFGTVALLIDKGKIFMNEKVFRCIWMVYFIFASFYFVWFVLQKKDGKGFHWFLPATWTKSDFYINLPELNEDGHKK